MSTIAHFTLAQGELMAEAGVFDGKHRQRVELIREEIRQMAPIRSQHCEVVDRLASWRFEHLTPQRVRVRIRGTLRMPALQSAPEPDLLWLVPNDYSQAHPQPEDLLLLIEVAESSLVEDTGEKAQLYAEAGIADYGVVNLIEQSIEVFRDPQAGGYQRRQIHRGEEMVHPPAFPETALRPAVLFSQA